MFFICFFKHIRRFSNCISAHLINIFLLVGNVYSSSNVTNKMSAIQSCNHWRLEGRGTRRGRGTQAFQNIIIDKNCLDAQQEYMGLLYLIRATRKSFTVSNRNV